MYRTASGKYLLLRLESNEPFVGDRSGAFRNHDYSPRKTLADIAGLCAGSMTNQTHPTPDADAGLSSWWQDLGYSRNQSYLFAFQTISHYLNWFMFEDGRERMHSEVHNYIHGVLAVYVVDYEYMKAGQFQAVMHRDHVQHICDLPCNLSESEYERDVINISNAC